MVAEGTPHQIATANPEFVMLAQRHVEFRTVLERTDLCMADGVGLLWAARHLGHPLPERVTGSDSVPMIAARAAHEGWRLYLLGAAAGVAERAAAILIAQNPDLKIAGVYAGSPAEGESPAIVARIRAVRPDILFVAYGAPAQDLWIARHARELGVPVMMGVGGTFDHIAGVKRRAPLWLQHIGLEWLFRLITQPRRWRRQLTIPQFVWCVLRSRPHQAAR
jgi:N-acetylglucosaminyldiphosphoundecaprenol N-acetyl-beta-D-mannosaminyltransferase